MHSMTPMTGSRYGMPCRDAALGIQLTDGRTEKGTYLYLMGSAKPTRGPKNGDENRVWGTT